MAPAFRGAALRRFPVAPVRHGGDAAGAEPDAALEPLRGAGGGAARPRGVAAGEGEAQPGRPGAASRGTRPAGKSGRPGSPSPRSNTVRLL